MVSTAATDQAEYRAAAALLDRIEHGWPVERALAAGADVNGHPRLDYRPLMVAAYSGNVRAALLLISKGADIDARALRNAFDDDGVLKICKGLRALHCAIVNGELGTFRVLIRAGADVNASDSRGHTPLMATCMGRGVPQPVVVQMARELLQAGADASIDSNTEGTALHFAAALGYVDLVAMLLVKAPQTLNSVCKRRGTPLFTAASIGSENVVSQLLAAGAQQPRPFHVVRWEGTGVRKSMHDIKTCPLAAAMLRSHERVVQVLLDGGIAAIGGLLVIESNLIDSLSLKKPRFLPMLLTVEGNDGQAYWAGLAPMGSPLLHWAASFGNPVAISVLLAAGADETVPGYRGKLPCEMIGLEHPGLLASSVRCVDSATKAAILRMLERAPAFRALSWLYPIKTMGDGLEDNGGAAGAPPGTQKASLVVRIYRSQRKIFFVTRIGRCEVPLSDLSGVCFNLVLDP